MHIAHPYCTSRQYLSMLWLRLHMIELFTKSLSKELSTRTPHRTLIDIVYDCNIGVVLFPNHWMIPAPDYIIVPFKEKILQKRWTYIWTFILLVKTTQ